MVFRRRRCYRTAHRQHVARRVLAQKLKERLKKEGNETVTSCHSLKLRAADGKQRATDVADTAQLLRLVQSIPSPKAEPVKQRLARVGYERIEETDDPELALDRAMETYLKKGYSTAWINQRLKSIETARNSPTNGSNAVSGRAANLRY